jgi:DNA polymerase-3 subunit delta'
VRFADVLGHGRAAARLQRAVAEARVPTAFLLLGPEGVGKRALADVFAARLLCGAPRDGDACGDCPSCTRVASGAHPDVRVVIRDEGRRDIRIEQVRELCRWLALQPLMAARKVAIVDGAHELNEHGQNALLRTLEEPPSDSVILLLATSASLLLPTVRSRCQVLRLDRLAPDLVARVLRARGLPSDRAELLAGLADGSPGRALGLDAEDVAKARSRIVAALPDLAALSAAEISSLAQELARGPLEAALAAAVAFYRDVLQVALGADALPIRSTGADAVVRAAAGRRPAAARLRQLEVVCDTLDLLGRNANRHLALETMLLLLRDLERGAASAWDSPPWTSRP